MNLKKLFLACVATASTLLMTSCFGDSENQTSAVGYFTIVGSQTSGYVLYMDGGGKVIPTASSVNELTGNKGFGTIERAQLTFTYKDSQLSQDQKTIEGAELVSGESIYVIQPTEKTPAAEQHITDADSLFNITKLVHAWAYRGYLTMAYNGSFCWNEKKTNYLYPSVNLVYDRNEMLADELNVHLCYNQRAKKDAPTAGNMLFTTSFDIRGLLNYTTGFGDSIRVNISADGISKPQTLKVARKDFVKGDWK